MGEPSLYPRGPILYLDKAERGVKQGIAIQFVSKVKAWLDEE